MGRLCWIVAMGLMWSIAAPRCAAGPMVVGDYNDELRKGGRVDIELMVERLTQLGANTYMWLIWHSPHDWEDLQLFLPRAQDAGIDVWVYLVPHSETAVSNPRFPYSEPYRLDYVRWAQEIAKLANEHPNLVGYVIDDFGANRTPDRFSTDYVRRMVAAGKTIAPRLKFYPLLYYREFNSVMMDQLGPLIDGAVAAYPDGPDDITSALHYLNDDYTEPARFEINYPSDTPSQAGDFGCVARRVTVTDASRASVRFSYTDSYSGPTSGYHLLRLLVDGQVAWESDAGDKHNGQATVDISPFVGQRKTVELRLGVWDAKAVSQFPLKACFILEQLDGLAGGEANQWRAAQRGAFRAANLPQRVGPGRWQLPLIVMTAASPGEFQKRHQIEPTPRNIADHVAMALQFARRGEIEGVVTYCLDKRIGSEMFDAVAEVFSSAVDEPVVYEHHERDQPRPLQIHTLRIDLRDPRVEVFTMIGDDPDGEGPAEAELTLPPDLAARHGALGAVNACAWRHLPSTDQAERRKGWYRGLAVDIAGLAVSGGQTRSAIEPPRSAMWFDAQGKPHFDKPGDADRIVHGGSDWIDRLLRDGEIVTADRQRHPRTMAGVDQAGRFLWFVVVDGRQPGYSEGITLVEGARIMQEFGCHNATNLDGGGSSIMLVQRDGALQVVNRPSGGRPRPVPVMWGVRLREAKP
jgi:hypothetical protein